MTLNMGGMHTFNPGSNLPTSGWNSQPDGQLSTQVSFYNPTSSTQILTNTFGMSNLHVSSNLKLGETSFTL
jgi:hypothetical protein